MRNLKKLVTILLTVAMLASMFAVPALAEETADALTLETLGVLKGTGNGVDAAYRASTPTRYQAAWLFLRLLGKEDDAKVWQGTLNFSDVDTAENAEGHKLNAENKKMLGYLYAHQNLGFRGYADDTFRPFVDVDAQMYYKLMLVALGYVEGTDFTWDTVFAKAIEVGLIAEAPAAGAAFTVDSIAAASVAALKTTYKGTTDSLVKKLVEVDKALDADKAVAAGLYVAPVVVLAVTDVKASDMGEIVVTFNSEVDKAKLDNFTVDGDAATATLSADGKVATVVVPNPKANGQTYALVVKKAIGLEADYTASITVFDTAKPTVVDVELTSPNTFEITFSEILAAVNGTIRINSGIYGISGAVRNGKVVTVTLASTTLPDGEYDIEVSGYTDLAGFVMDKTVQKLTYAKDVTKPTATLVSQSQTELVIRFNEPVTLSATKTNYYHTFAHYIVSNAPTLVDGTEADYRFEFLANGFPIPAGSTTFYIKADAVVDTWGNKMGAASFPVLDIKTDTTKPSVVSAPYAAGKIVVTFDEPVNATDATTAANFEVKLGTKSATITNIAYDANKLQTTLTLAPLEGGRWTIVVKNVKDLSLAGNVVNENANLFSVDDEIPIDTTKVKATIVTGAAGGNDIIYLTYPEAMNDTVLNPSYYMLRTGAATSLLSAKTVKIEANGTNAYKITRAYDDTLVAGTSVLVVGRVQDVAGNAPAAFSFDVTLVAEVAPAVVAVAQTDYNKLAVTFDKLLTDDYTLEAFRFSVDGVVYHTPAMFDSKVDKDGKTTLSFIITADLISAIEAVSPDYKTNTAEVIGKGDLAGITLELIADKVTSASGMKNVGAQIAGLNTDGRAPIYKSNAPRVFNGILGTALIFSEPIADGNSAYYANDLVVKKDTTVMIAGVEYQTVIDTSDGAIIVYATGATSFTTASAINLIKDAAGNKMAAVTEEAKLPQYYTTAMDPVYNKADTSGVGPPPSTQYLLPEVYTGTVTINFDMCAVVANADFQAGFVDKDVAPLYKYYTHNAIAIALGDAGTIKARNGGSWVTGGAYTVNTEYHIRVVADMDAHTWNGWWTAPGGEEVQFATNFAFRNGGEIAPGIIIQNSDDIAMVVAAGGSANRGYIKNLVVTDDTP